MTTAPQPIEWPEPPHPGEPMRDKAADAQLAMTIEMEKLEILEAIT